MLSRANHAERICGRVLRSELQQPCFSIGAELREPPAEPQLRVVCLDDARWNLLHVNIPGGCRAAVTQHALDILQAALLLRQRSDASPDHLEGQLGRMQFLYQPAQHPVAEVAGIRELAFPVRNN